MTSSTLEEKKTRLFIVLSGIFITNALVAEMIGVKIFSGEQTLGLEPARMNIFGYISDFNLTAGAVIWPVVFITSDLINEYFGRPGVKRISYLTAILITYAFLVIFVTIRLSPADFWLDAYSKDSAGNYFDMNYAFNTIFGQGQRIIVGSLTAFLIGQLIDAFLFQKLKKITGKKMLWVRATGSTLISQLIDSFVVLYIAFAGIFDDQTLLGIALTNYIYKFIVAVALTPVIYFGHFLIDRYLGKENSEKIAEAATNDSGKFF
ncbi:MAG TPA: queuosine precursor transporter [Cyclobacteriaceae bacterium]|nr:queuosine precursor transporter [Cyclobacteriaceae bacterium]